MASIVPGAYSWPTLLAKDGDELFDHYRHAGDAGHAVYESGP